MAGAALLLSQWMTGKAVARLARQPRVRLGPLTVAADEAPEWRQAMALAHDSLAAVVAVAAGFELVDPAVREGRYWMLLAGERSTPSVDETVRVAESSDAILVP